MGGRGEEKKNSKLVFTIIFFFQIGYFININDICKWAYFMHKTEVVFIEITIGCSWNRIVKLHIGLAIHAGV